MRILVVEDEIKTAAYLNKGLSESGFRVDIANNGEDGLHLALNHRYDLIILDVMLPKRWLTVLWKYAVYILMCVFYF